MGNGTFWIVFVIALIVCVAGTHIWKNYLLKKLLKQLQKEEYEGYFKTLNGLACKYFYPPFNREYMRMNAYMMQGDVKKIDEQFDVMLNMRINKKQAADIVTKAFYFYVDEENKEKTSALLERLKTCADEDVVRECSIIYDIFIRKSTEHMVAMEEAVKVTEGPNRGMFYFMLALQYGYTKERKKRKDALHAALTDLKGTPYEIKIKQLLQEK